MSLTSPIPLKWSQPRAGAMFTKGRSVPERFARPAMLPLLVVFAIICTIDALLYSSSQTWINWWLTVVWSLPVAITFLQIRGILHTRRHFNDAHGYQGRSQQPLIVLIPTIGRHDVMGALDRVVRSFAHECPAYFDDWRVDIVTEEKAEALVEMQALAQLSPDIRVLVIPADYQSATHTQYKARANQFALEERTAHGESTEDAWVLHMDDDTAVGEGTMQALAHFLSTNNGDKHLAQGVLTYPRQHSVNGFTWLLDSVRPGFDVSLYAALTGTGTPLIGTHGELLLIRASIEAEIGWDFGPKEIVEDARFSLLFATRYPGCSAWFAGRCYGSSPETLRDFIQQRARWSEGLLRLALNRTIPLRKRVLLAYAMIGWQIGIFQHLGIMIPLALLVTNGNTCPVAAPLIVAWALYYTGVLWANWEGLKINSQVSGFAPRRRDQFVVTCLQPIVGIFEPIGGTLGAYRAITNRGRGFTVIAKNN